VRILIASDFYPPFIGGAERQTQLLSRELARRGHDVIVATVWSPGQERESVDGQVRVFRLKGLTTIVPWFSIDPGRRYHPPFPDPAIAWGLRRLVARFQPDTIHVSFGWIAYSCAAALLGLDLPLIVSTRDYGYSCAVRTLMHYDEICSGPGLRKCLDCAMHFYGVPKGAAAALGVFASKPLLTRKLTILHCISTFVQQIMRRDFVTGWKRLRGLRQEIIPDLIEVVIPNLVVEGSPSTTARIYDAALNQWIARLPDEPFILFVGALQAHKGLQPLLDAYGQLASPPPLVLLGSVWPDTPAIYPPGVTVLHNVPHDAVMAAWERCLFGVAPSLVPETFGNVITEAMSKGKPIIATNVGGPTDIIVDGKTGFLVPLGDIWALTAAMQRLCDDAELRTALGQAGKERVNIFAPEVVMPQIERLYLLVQPVPVVAQ
jgi:glycosyltransferase involved in cell wall biosynthesis